MEAADKRQSGHLNSARSGHLNLTATLSAPVKNVLPFSRIEMSCADIQSSLLVLMPGVVRRL